MRSQANTDIVDIEAYLEEDMESPQNRDIAKDNFIKKLENLKASIHNIGCKTFTICNDRHTASAQDPEHDQDRDTKREENVSNRVA